MFYYNDVVMNDMISSVGKNIEEITNMEDGYTSKMKPVSNSGLYGNGIELINSQMISIKEGLNNFKNLTVNNCRAVEDMENKLTKEVDKIELPKDFDATDVGVSVKKEDINLFKENGNKIKLDETIKEEFEDNYNIAKETLEKFVNKALEDSELKDYTDTKTIDLNEIKDSEVKQSELEDYDEIDYDEINNEILNEINLLKENNLYNIELEGFDNIEGVEDEDKS